MNRLEKLITETLYLEARRNPELNKKQDIRELYDKYHNDKGIFISFVHDMGDIDGTKIKSNKIGINPKSIYTTPNGIYSYPLHIVYNDNYQKGVSIPFGGDRPYVYFIRPIGNHIENLSKLESTEALKYVKGLVSYFSEISPLPEIDEHYLNKNFVSFLNDKFIGGAFLWNTTKVFSTIYYYFKKYHKKNLLYHVSSLSKSLEHNRNQPTVWNFPYSPNVWNFLFSKVMGIDSIADYGTSGIIHPLEPDQCVFFNTKALEIVDFAENKTSILDKWFKNKNLTDREKINMISKDAESSYQYAKAIKRRFPRGELEISRDEEFSEGYAWEILKREERIDFIKKYNINFPWTKEVLNNRGNFDQI